MTSFTSATTTMTIAATTSTSTSTSTSIMTPTATATETETETENKSELITKHILIHLGPQQALPHTWLIPLTMVYVIILISGLLGNMITILVIFRFRYMQTITNLYLCNLAVTDLISLMFSLPLELYTLWHQYPWQLGSVMCSLKTLVLEGTANASVLTLVAFTVERFLAICGSSKRSIPPSTQTLFNGKSISKIKRIACRNIALIWTISLCGATPLVLLTRINYLDHDNIQLTESAWCGLAYNEPDKRWELIMLSSTIVFFLIPLIIISCLYYQIARKLKKATRLEVFNHSDVQLTDHATSRKIIQSRKIVIRMLVVIVIAFTFCWSPFHAQRLLFLYVTLYSSWNIVTRQINGILFLSAGCLYYLNSSLNPLIYSLLSTRFRAAFMLYVRGCCGHGMGSVAQSTSGPQQQQQQQQNQQQMPRSKLRNASNSNNSVLLMNGSNNGNVCHGNHQLLRNVCLITTDPSGKGAKIKWNNNNNNNNNSNNSRQSNESNENQSTSAAQQQQQQQHIEDNRCCCNNNNSNELSPFFKSKDHHHHQHNHRHHQQYQHQQLQKPLSNNKYRHHYSQNCFFSTPGTTSDVGIYNNNNNNHQTKTSSTATQKHQQNRLISSSETSATNRMIQNSW